jgi:pimeloyl-ACP methyl ester carboxylesterase
VAALARALGRDFRVLEPLQRRAGSARLDVDRHVADLDQVTPDALALVGSSWGAMLALSFAWQRPGKVSALVLVGCGTYDLASRARYHQAMAERGGPHASQAFDALPDAEPELPPDMVGHEETWSDVLRRQAEGLEPAAFAAVRCPVLMLHGAQDPHPGPSTRDVLRRYVPHLEYREFDRCGHTPWLERHARDPFLEVLRAWLAERAGRARQG